MVSHQLRVVNDIVRTSFWYLQRAAPPLARSPAYEVPRVRGQVKGYFTTARGFSAGLTTNYVVVELTAFFIVKKNPVFRCIALHRAVRKGHQPVKRPNFAAPFPRTTSPPRAGLTPIPGYLVPVPIHSMDKKAA